MLMFAWYNIFSCYLLLAAIENYLYHCTQLLYFVDYYCTMDFPVSPYHLLPAIQNLPDDLSVAGQFSSRPLRRTWQMRPPTYTKHAISDNHYLYGCLPQSSVQHTPPTVRYTATAAPPTTPTAHSSRYMPMPATAPSSGYTSRTAHFSRYMPATAPSSGYASRTAHSSRYLSTPALPTGHTVASAPPNRSEATTGPHNGLVAQISPPNQRMATSPSFSEPTRPISCTNQPATTAPPSRAAIILGRAVTTPARGHGQHYSRRATKNKIVSFTDSYIMSRPRSVSCASVTHSSHT